MRDLLARRGEVIALTVADLDFVPDGSATALIRRSKADQADRGQVRWTSPRAVARPRCVLAKWHLVAWIRQESSRISHLWRLADSEILSVFSGLAYPCNKVEDEG